MHHGCEVRDVSGIGSEETVSRINHKRQSRRSSPVHPVPRVHETLTMSSAGLDLPVTAAATLQSSVRVTRHPEERVQEVEAGDSEPEADDGQDVDEEGDEGQLRLKGDPRLQGILVVDLEDDALAVLESRGDEGHVVDADAVLSPA